MKPGLVSVTFRQLSAIEVIQRAAEVGLRCIEWGGDIHVPHGNRAVATQVGAATRAANLAVSAYGSYYRVGVSPGDGLTFESVLDTAVALGAPVIRVWAGNCASSDADPAFRQQVIDDALRIADLAAKVNVTVAYEYHANTLTDTIESAVQLLNATDHPAIQTFWQPPNGQPLETCLESLRSVLPRVRNVHVFHWWPDSSIRLPLAEGTTRWQQYLAVLKAAGKEPDLLLEFVPDNDPAILSREAATLNSWLA